MSKRKPKTYPEVRLSEQAFDDFPASLAKTLREAPTLYLLSPPGPNGLAFVGTSADGRGCTCTFVRGDCILP